MGEAKRRKKLGLPPRKLDENKFREEIGLPPKEIDKEEIKKNVKSAFSKYPFIPFIFYLSGIFVLILGIIKIINLYK